MSESHRNGIQKRKHRKVKQNESNQTSHFNSIIEMITLIKFQPPDPKVVCSKM